MMVGQAAKRVRDDVAHYYKMRAIVTAFHADCSERRQILQHLSDPLVQRYIGARVFMDSFDLKLRSLPFAEYEFLNAMLQHGYRTRWWESMYSTSTYYRMLQRVDYYFKSWSGAN